MQIFRSRKKIIVMGFLILTALFLISGCENISKKDIEDNKLVIAEQYGLAYAPVQLIKELKLLENSEAELKVEWKQLSNTAAIRESMLAGEVDIAFMAIPPFLIAKDKGMDWKIISGLSESPLSLMVNRKYINRLNDFKENDKIALPQPGSIQHILLSMAAKRNFNNPQKFDNQLLTMKHPDAMNALLSKKEVVAHFASPPYLFLESKEKGIKELLTAKEAFGGEFTFIVGVSSLDFYQNNTQKYELFVNVLNTALKRFKEKPQLTAKMLADNYNLEVDEITEYLNWPGLEYSSKIKGLRGFIDFMQAEAYLKKREYKLSELVFKPELVLETNQQSAENNLAIKEADLGEK